MVGRLPWIVVCLIAAITASAAAAGTSTVEKLSVMLIGPMSRPVRSDSLAMAPTRSPGPDAVLAAEADEQPGLGAALVAAARLARAPGAGRAGRPACASRPLVAAGHELGDLDLVDLGLPGLVDELDGGRGRRRARRPRADSSSTTASKRSRSSALQRAAQGGASWPPSGGPAGRRRTAPSRSAIGRPRDALDVAEQPQLAGLGQRDGDALAPGPADPADAVHVGVGRRRHVVVDDVGEQVDVEAAGGDVGGDRAARRCRCAAAP